MRLKSHSLCQQAALPHQSSHLSKWYLPVAQNKKLRINVRLAFWKPKTFSRQNSHSNLTCLYMIFFLSYEFLNRWPESGFNCRRYILSWENDFNKRTMGPFYLITTPTTRFLCEKKKLSIFPSIPCSNISCHFVFYINIQAYWKLI